MTIVTALILPRDGITAKPIEHYLEQFNFLIETGLNIVLFLDRRLEGRIPDHPNITIIYTSIFETWYWNNLGTGSYQIPVRESRDTLDYSIIINSKLEFLAEALDITSDEVMFVDFGVAHVIKDREAVKKKLQSIKSVDGIWTPGCWETKSDVMHYANWRFSGGFILGDRDSLKKFWEDSKIALESVKPWVTWEVNIWAWMEIHMNYHINWYYGNHDDGLILNLPDNSASSKIKDITLVTSFFPGDSINNIRSLTEYYTWAKELLSLNVPFHIFIDSRYYDLFKELREGKEKITHWDVQDINFLPMMDSLSTAINNSNLRNYKPDARWSPQYQVLTNSKFTFTKRASEENVFNSSHLAWIDFGIMKTGTTKEKILDTINKKVDKFKIGLLGVYTKELSRNFPEFFQFGRPVAIGGFWMASRDSMLKVSNLCIKKYYETVNAGFGHADEQTLYLTWLDHPELIDVYAGDYSTIFDNYHGIQELSNIHRVISTCQESGFDYLVDKFNTEVQLISPKFPELSIEASHAIVTAFILPPNHEPNKPISRYLELFSHFETLSAPVILFLDKSIEWRPNGSHITIIPTSYEDLWVSKFLENKEISLPQVRGETKDTREYLTIVNSKTEFMMLALGYTNAKRLTWVDFGIAHMLENPHEFKKLENLKHLQSEILVSPSMNPNITDVLDEVTWRFPGTLFSGTRSNIKDLFEASKRTLQEIYPKLSWEGNVWAYAEARGYIHFNTYPARFSNAILDFDGYIK